MTETTEPPVVDPASPAGPDVDGRAARWTGQQERRRTEFVDAAITAIDLHGADVSTEQIAAQAGVARTRLYRHFAGAADLNRAIASRAEAMVIEGLASAWDPAASPDHVIRTAVAAHLRWLIDHRELYRYLTRHSVATSSGDDAVSDVKRLISHAIVELIEGYVVLLDLDATIVQPLSFGMVGFVDAAAVRWVEDPRGVELDEMVDLLSGWLWSILDGVLRERGIELDPTQPVG